VAKGHSNPDKTMYAAATVNTPSPFTADYTFIIEEKVLVWNNYLCEQGRKWTNTVTEVDLMASARRVAWTINYWSNVWNDHHLVPDPLQVCTITQKSEWGFTAEGFTNDVANPHNPIAIVV